MIFRTSSPSDCEATCPRVGGLEKKVEELKEENTDLRQEKREVEKKLNYWKERHARLWDKYRKVTSSNKPSSKKTRYEKEEEKRRKRERKKRRKGDEDTGGEEEDEEKGKPGRKPESRSSLD
ncbi:hypothetical protein AKJ40_02025 [candidate division MSBL1 archaeon SCGC-AAA259M10]|uniref:Uncharacterized protein n=1 Tax=candidate division MSBL1 archaeon SCGC-AAA259M10 TaxID=1698270 RepID=A0A133V0P0_9EURY|nr:hypothetical protein AKJ40_02025 [candidate division MSBL1 archaeon SCGC-AAA259M10]